MCVADQWSPLNPESTKKGEMLPVVAARQRVIQVSLQHDVKLNKAENAWKPVLNKKDLNEDDGDAATQVALQCGCLTCHHTIV